LLKLFWIAAFVAVPTFTFAASSSAPPLPDAPQPVPHRTAAKSLQSAPATAGAVVRYAPLYARTIFPGETAHRLTSREKLIYAGRQWVEPVNLLPALLTTGWSQYQNSDPRYGTGADAFGQRFGAAIAREDSDRLFTDGLLPAVLHEDPRYYRKGESASNFHRGLYALGQTFVTRTDEGKVIPNYSGFLGRGMALGLTYAYYPAASRNGGVLLRGFGSSVGGLAVFNLLREFVPREVFSHLTIFRDPDSVRIPAASPEQ
jgi:hypothetical protein